MQELAGPDDQWITVVDSARMTGASESMANRWVTSGRLPIRGNPETLEEDRVGNPPRTRQYRLSDVAAIHPILYPEQAVSTVVRTLHLLSIPQEVSRLTREHQQIAADHQRLMQKLTELLEAVDAIRVQFHREMQQQGEDHRRQVHVLQEELAPQLQEAEARLQASLRTLSEQYREAVQAMQGKYNEVARKVEVYREQRQQALDALAADQQRNLLAYQQAVDA